jgi:chromosome segregation ATPase
MKKYSELNRIEKLKLSLSHIKSTLEYLNAQLENASDQLEKIDSNINSPAPFPPPLTEENEHEAAQLAAELTDEQKEILNAEQHYLEQLGAQDFDNIGNYKFWI